MSPHPAQAAVGDLQAPDQEQEQAGPTGADGLAEIILGVAAHA